MSAAPLVSVVVATHNRAARLAELLESLRALRLQRGRFEVVVVDDGSSDHTASVLEVECARGGLDLRTITRAAAGGPAVARNAGWHAASAPLIAFTDDDCVVAEDWLEAGLHACAEDPEAIVQGRTDPNPAEADSIGAFSRTLTVHEAGPYYQTCNIFYPRDVLERLGGFDEEAFSLPKGEDTDLAWRALESGVPIVYAGGVRVYHAVNQIGAAAKLKLAWDWSEAHQIFARHPGLRQRTATWWIFWKQTHYLLFRAILGVLAGRSRPRLGWWLMAPYVRVVYARAKVEGGSLSTAPFYLAFDAVEVAGALRASIRYRMLLL